MEFGCGVLEVGDACTTYLMMLLFPGNFHTEQSIPFLLGNYVF